jgi:hypothetical protein
MCVIFLPLGIASGQMYTGIVTGSEDVNSLINSNFELERVISKEARRKMTQRFRSGI